MASDLPRDASATKARILAAAKSHFSVSGYDRTTVRAVALDARVSPNLITRYFGGKDGLCRAATEIDIHVTDALRGPKTGFGARLAAHVVTRWESTLGSDPLLTMLRAAMTDPDEAARMAEFFQQQATTPIAEYLGGDDRRERAAAISVFITGTITQRYVLTAGPIAAATPDQLIAWLGRNLQRLADARALPSLGG
jgi:AcrR family transcriptional regulator